MENPIRIALPSSRKMLVIAVPEYNPLDPVAKAKSPLVIYKRAITRIPVGASESPFSGLTPSS
jgi:hypothetical protein